MPNRKLCLAALLLLSTSALAQDKTLTFDNASPVKTVHLLNGTSVSIGTTGNLVAKCVLNGTTCADVGSGTGGGGALPSVSLAASSFSTTADQGGAYSANTSFTLTPAVTNAQVCWRRITTGTIAGAWTGAISTGLNTAVTGITLGTASTSYTYRLDCFNDSGSAYAEFQVSTNAGSTNPPPSACPIADWTPTLTDYGFTRQSNPTAWLQIQGVPNFPSSANVFTDPDITVPRSSAGLVFIGSDRSKWISVQFTTPATFASGDLTFNDSQVPGTSTSTKGLYYMTISRCMGDFRYNIAGPTEPSEGQACKSLRKTAAGGVLKLETLRWDLSDTIQNGTTAQPTCGLAPGTTYYLNYANVNPDDGITTSEHNCPNNVSNCGVQFKSN